MEDTEELHINIIKIKIQCNPSSATSETYNLKMDIFNNIQPEEFIVLLNSFKEAIDGTGSTTVSRQIYCLCTVLWVEALQ